MIMLDWSDATERALAMNDDELYFLAEFSTDLCSSIRIVCLVTDGRLHGRLFLSMIPTEIND